MHTIYLVPHSHYDAVWAFTKDDYTYINELILSKAVELMRKSDYKFQIEQTFLLEELEERNPKLWSDLRAMIRKGKLEIVDGQYLMPDSMLPDGEVLIREIIVGKLYCRKKFGVEVPVAWAADGFGLNAQIPQIYKKAGYQWLAFRRGARKRISEFIWRGLDGTKILVHWMPLGYRAGLNLDKLKQSFDKIKACSVTSHVLMPSGSGVTIPQEDTMEFVDNWNKTHDDIKIKIATASEFFKALEAEKTKFKIMSGEMYSGRYSEVFPDVCSSRIWVIIGARKCESLMFSAERFATISWLLGAVYPEVMLTHAWKRLLFIAFHDVFPGTSIDEVYYPVKGHFFALERDLNKIIRDSIQYIAARINTDENAVIVFNPLTWKVDNWVEVDIELPRGAIHTPWLQDVDGNVVAVEVLDLWRYEDGSVKRAKLGFIASVPSFGYTTYRIIEGESATSHTTGDSDNGLKVHRNTIENKYFRLKIDEDTGIVELTDLDNRLVMKGNELVIEDESGDLYYHQGRLPMPIKTEGGQGQKYGAFKPKRFRVEQSAVRARIIFENEFYTLRWPYRLTEKYEPLLYRHKAIDACKEVIVYKDLPRVDFVTAIDNKYPYVRIRVKFDVNVERSKYSRGTQFGVTEETTIDKIHLPRDSIELFSRAPAINWVDYHDDDKGLTLINDGNPENELKTGSIYLTLLRSVSCLSVDGHSGPMIPTPNALELRKYTFRYAVYPHLGNWKTAKSYKPALEFCRPLVAIQSGGRKSGELPPSYSFLRLEPDNLVISAFKRAEASNDVILRFYETSGKRTTARIEMFRPVKGVSEVNLLEDEVKNKKQKIKKLSPNTLSMKIKPFEIKTLKLLM